MIAKNSKKVKGIISDLKRKVILGGLIFLVVFMLYTNIKILEERKRAEKELFKIEEQIKEEEKEKDKYNFQLGKSNTEEYLEKVAREELGLQKPGEQVVIIKKQEEEKRSEQIEDQGFVEKIFNWFRELLPE